jgi:hypothetical protein
VLGIVVILAAVLFPLFARGGHGHGPSCQSNLKQVGLGFIQYTQDYDERFPLIAISAVASSTQPFSKPYGWADALQTYLRSTGIYHCPIWKNENDYTKENRRNDAVLSYFTDYYYNTNLDRGLLKNLTNPPRSFYAVKATTAPMERMRATTATSFRKSGLIQKTARRAVTLILPITCLPTAMWKPRSQR